MLDATYKSLERGGKLKKSIPKMDDERHRKDTFAWNVCTSFYIQHLASLEQPIQERHHAHEIAE